MLRRFFPFTIAINNIYEPEYQAVLDRATLLGYTLPDSTTNIRNNLRVKYLKDQGLWTSLDLFYIFDNPSGLANFSRINYVDPNNFELTDLSGGMNFIPDQGFRGNSTGSLNTNWNVLNDSVNYLNNNGSIGFASSTSPAGGGAGSVCGARTANDNSQIFIFSNSATLTTYRLQTFLSSTVSASNLFPATSLLSRDASGQNVYIDGVLEDSDSLAAPLPLVNLDLYIGSLNSSGTEFLLANANWTFRYFYIGSNLSASAVTLHEIMTDTYTP